MAILDLTKTTDGLLALGLFAVVLPVLVTTLWVCLRRPVPNRELASASASAIAALVAWSAGFVGLLRYTHPQATIPAQTAQAFTSDLATGHIGAIGIVHVDAHGLYVDDHIVFSEPSGSWAQTTVAPATLSRRLCPRRPGSPTVSAVWI